ncbi:uncharacterized protein LOC133887666 isoform X2 [Phragmites australis]|uniref:uncharacterized protein LOC133887666 isoform X2 n=1 Tax=Phragmites australis TaxID=29695 RepID=UPI002D79A518|nr:uncharacterized protein LOC133887666 isoform X2 [Phragmites australis]
MDQHKEKEENKYQESTDQHNEEEEEENNSEESMDRRGGYKVERNSEESTGQLKEVEEGGSEEASSLFGIFANPCSPLQYLLRACAGCLGLQGSFSDPKPAAVAPEAAAPANSPQEGEGGEKANEVVTRVWAVRRPRPPDRPREGNGGNGGNHH